jgi:8-oxo-dGTP pyrophosphatase MutT (NUDIX family)
MGASDYVKELRALIGDRLLLLPGVAAIIRDDEGRVLLQRRAQDGRWSLPAGAIDPGESPAEAIVRECFEETGLHVRPERVLGVFGGADGFRAVLPGGDRVEYTAIVFACAVVGGTLGGRDGETAELAYVHPAARPPLVTEYPIEAMLAADQPVFQRVREQARRDD